MSDLARIGGPVACIGLAVLLTARGRGNRIAGLAYAAVGTLLIVISVAPAKAGELAAVSGAALVVAPLLALLFRLEPWLVAFGTLAFVPLRLGLFGHQLLVPLYAIALGSAALLALQPQR